MAALSKEQIINLALKSAQTTPLASSRQGEYDDIYELKKNSLLNERIWPFTLRLLNTSQITQTTAGADINFDYKYQLPPGVTNVVHIAASADQLAPQRGGVSTLTNRQALRNGYAPLTPEDRIDIIANQGNDFMFTNGLLYSTNPVGAAIVQMESAESDFPEDFTLTLAYQLAAHFARSVKGNPALGYELERQAKQHQGRAVRPITQRAKRIDDIIFNRWLEMFYTERYR